jgi:bifunctional DNA-binding transcriptional regulator/antitoxin component of YhaV-PrlF toxin-antitoxin module
MPRVETKDSRLTVPVSDEVREKLGLHDGDELAVHVVGDSVVYTPAAPDGRERAWQRILSITDKVQPMREQAAKPIDVGEQEIVEDVHAFRRARRTGHA